MNSLRILPTATRLAASGLALVLFSLLAGCVASGPLPAQRPATSFGTLTVFDGAFNKIVSQDARVEKLAEGFTWSEGPAWISDGQYLLFTDVPQNTMYRWNERDGLSVFLKPSGYAGPDDGTLREAGANGLFAGADGQLLLADSGSRLVAMLNLQSKQKRVFASHFQGKRFNSPNDVVQRNDGAVFFTDPPYGLKDLNDSAVKELAFNGVYRLDADGGVHLLDAELGYPNGIALSPDERTLYVSNSDPTKPIWMAYTLDAVGNVIDKRVFADASDLLGEGVAGLPDGMAVAADGTLFATGPGGVLVFNAQGKRLGRIETGTAVSNCAFGDDGKTLYMSSHHLLARIRLKTLGVGFPR